MEEKEIGVISHFYGQINVGVIDLTKGDLKVGDTVHIKGHTTDFTQEVESIQIEHENVEEAKKGQSIGLRVIEHVREHDVVYKVVEE